MVTTAANAQIVFFPITDSMDAPFSPDTPVPSRQAASVCHAAF
jgi:hypothetical protein